MSSKDESTDVQLDISKYEGHTPGPWLIKYASHDSISTYDAFIYGGKSPGKDGVLMFAATNNPYQRFTPNLKLVADAPLLLEEVKRLQRRLMLAESALGEIRAYHESGQGNLGEIIEHYHENEQVEMPNAFDEDDA